jgi:S1-C subfamily serine protease
MKLYIIAIVTVLILPFACHAKTESQDEPVKLAPYKVEVTPFGFLGIKHATISLNPWKLVVGMKSVRFLQIDELDPNSPGVAAGVLPGDHVVSIGGVAVTSIGLRKLRHMGDEVEVGQKITVEVLRPSDGSKRILEVIVPKKPKQPNPEGRVPR